MKHAETGGVEGLGYVEIDNPEEYDNLPTPLRGFDKAVFTTSVTHQLHCLVSMLLKLLWVSRAYGHRGN